MSAIKTLINKQNRKVSIAIIGLTNSGKSELVKRILQSDEHILASVGNTSEFEFQMFGNLTLLTWDLKNSIPANKALWKRSILGADALFFVVDTTDRESFDLNRKLLLELIYENFPIRLLVLGSKSDLPSSASVGELINSLRLMELDSTKCKCDLFKYSSKTGEGLYAIEEWLNKVLFKQRERIINYVKIAACMAFFEESNTQMEAILDDTPNISLLTTMREVKRKIAIFSRTMRYHDVGEEVIEIASYKAIILKFHTKIVALIVGSNDSIPRAIEIAKNIHKVIQPYNDQAVKLHKIISDLYPLDTA